MAQGIRGLVSIGKSVFGSRATPMLAPPHSSSDEERGLSPAEAYANSVKGGMLRSQGHPTVRAEHGTTK